MRYALVPRESFRRLLPAAVTHKLLLVPALSLLAFALGCGSSGSSIPITGGFSNSSLNGQYTYHLSGQDTNGNYTEAGVFTADGNGNITGGTDDFNQNGQFASNPITGRYTISKDGNGTILFTVKGTNFQVGITLISSTQLYLTEVDNFANASGEADKQDSTAFAGPPSGTFAFRIHDVGSTSVTGMVGAITSTSGAVSGTLDELRGGTFTPNATFASGNFVSPDATGRGTVTFTDSLGIVSSYVYYVIDASTVNLLQSDANNLGLGRMEKQSGSHTLSGNYVFGSQGDTSNLGGVRTVGGFTADGVSAITGGSYDSVQDGNSIVNQPFTGSFAAGVATNGRVDVTLSPNGAGPIAEVFWMVNSGRAFFLVNDPGKVEDGTIDQQTGSFSNATLKGQYALVMDGLQFSTGSTTWLTRVGTFIPDGNGNLNLNEVANSFDPVNGAIVNNVGLSGTYTVGSNGRATSAINNLSNNLVLYMASPNQAYILQNDVGVEISGKVTLQVSP